MSGYVSPRLVREVRQRAGDICEYCLLPQETQEATFHVDHIVPRSRKGETDLNNLALACVSCSLRKAARLRVLDNRTGKLVPLYNPRLNGWGRHFAITKRWRLRGRTPTGRATIDALAMNRAVLIAIRKELALLDRYPPESS